MTALRYHFIRTPLQEPLTFIRSLLDPSRFKRPELREIRREDARILRILRRVLQPESNCIDIGCHYGSMLSRMTRLAPRGRHLAFEAIPDKVAFLRRKFPDVEIVQVALGERAERRTFWINRSHSGFSGLTRHGDGEFSSLDVDCRRLDDAAPRDRRWNLVKIDVEGAELMVLRGGAELLARDGPSVLFECGPSAPRTYGYEPVDLFDWFKEREYEIYLPKSLLEGASPIDRDGFARSLKYPFQAFNWFAVPRFGSDRTR